MEIKTNLLALLDIRYRWKNGPLSKTTADIKSQPLCGRFAFKLMNNKIN